VAAVEFKRKDKKAFDASKETERLWMEKAEK
jgi:hypothetical protein